LICSILQKPKNSNHYIPGRYRGLHLIERLNPGLLDKKFGLKPRIVREKRLKKVAIDNALILGASTDVGKKLAYLNAKTVKRLYLVDKDGEPLQRMKREIEATHECDVDVATFDL
jgi:hypothetical protein